VKRWHLDDALVMHLANRYSGGEAMPTVQLVRRYRERETILFLVSGTLGDSVQQAV
jgi:hypothetical protein